MMLPQCKLPCVTFVISKRSIFVASKLYTFVITALKCVNGCHPHSIGLIQSQPLLAQTYAVNRCPRKASLHSVRRGEFQTISYIQEPFHASERMLYFALIIISLTFINGILLPESARPVDWEINQTFDNNLAQGHDIFEKAAELMENTQHKLEGTVPKKDKQSAKSTLHPPNLPPSNYQNESSSESVVGNKSINTADTINKGINNTTGDTHINKAKIQSSRKENNLKHECIINDDCDRGKYCRYETHRSKCLNCKALDVPCKKDEECCTGQLCVWGQCTQNAIKGEAGSICQYQNECRPDLCCAFHKALQFPVCMAKPIERERCFAISNHLMELLSWDMDGKGPRKHCPCAGGLKCKRLSQGAMCLKGQNSSEEDLTDTLYSEIDYIV
ncbi:hypothetical protein UPYG_G00083770 [Umbra pygmaea]|uniref:Dickkopf N-terminal cysteine-rich domain-containing protein n=1 Tax=Umbra pygmaea TaxID=75934 RepID=A0ABD0XE91_UMBPY